MLKTCPDLKSDIERDLKRCSGVSGDLDKYYYQNRDLKLLLDLLATKFGCMASIRILAMFDEKFGENCRPGDLKFAQPYYHNRKVEINIANEVGVTERIDKTKVYDIDLQFVDAPVLNDIFRTTIFQKYNCLYTVEILPSTPRFCVKEIKVF